MPDPRSSRTPCTSRPGHAGHPALGAVHTQSPSSVGVGHGPGAHAGDVAAGMGLGQPEAGARSPWRSRQVALLLVSSPAIKGPVGSRVSSSIRAAVLEYFATSSMAMSARGCQPPSRRARRAGTARAGGVAEHAKTSSGYSPSCRLPARGLTLSWARRRTDSWRGGEFGREVEVHEGRGYPRRIGTRPGRMRPGWPAARSDGGFDGAGPDGAPGDQTEGVRPGWCSAVRRTRSPRSSPGRAPPATGRAPRTRPAAGARPDRGRSSTRDGAHAPSASVPTGGPMTSPRLMAVAGRANR